MANIEIPTYKTIVPNEVFGRKGRDLRHSLFGIVPSTQILLLERYTFPSQKEVIDSITKKAGEIDFDSFDRKEVAAKKKGIARYLALLSDAEIESIAKGDGEFLGHLIRHYPGINLESGRGYVEVTNGNIPNDFLDSIKKDYEDNDKEIYEKALRDINENNWRIRVRLLKECVLPKGHELEYLLSMGVRDSDVFSVKGDFGGYEDISSQIRMLYNTLRDSDVVSKIKDNSENLLGEIAASAIVHTAGCIERQKIVDNIFSTNFRGRCVSVFDDFAKDAGHVDKKHMN